jgi:hypothetical protein
VLFGRNRESRSREAAGRRNWPEAVPRKMRGRKRLLTALSDNLSCRGLDGRVASELLYKHHSLKVSLRPELIGGQAFGRERLSIFERGQELSIKK